MASAAVCSSHFSLSLSLFVNLPTFSWHLSEALLVAQHCKNQSWLSCANETSRKLTVDFSPHLQHLQQICEREVVKQNDVHDQLERPRAQLERH